MSDTLAFNPAKVKFQSMPREADKNQAKAYGNTTVPTHFDMSFTAVKRIWHYGSESKERACLNTTVILSLFPTVMTLV